MDGLGKERQFLLAPECKGRGMVHLVCTFCFDHAVKLTPSSTVHSHQRPQTHRYHLVKQLSAFLVVPSHVSLLVREGFASH